MRRNNIMKVIELLLQGNKVWDKDKKGYFELGQDSRRLYYVSLGKYGRVSYPEIKLELALREGKIYEEGDIVGQKEKGD